MSKKCCGILHSEDEQVCRVCGKPLASGNESPEYQAEGAETREDAPASDAVTDESSVGDAVKEAAEPTGAAEYTQAAEPAGAAESVEAPTSAEAVESVQAIESPAEAELAAGADGDNGGREKRKTNIDKAPKAIKVIGVLSIILSVLGLAAVSLSVLFLVVFPSYKKEGAADRELKFESDTASASDSVPRPLLTPTDAEIEEYFEVKDVATGTDATPEDAAE